MRGITVCTYGLLWYGIIGNAVSSEPWCPEPDCCGAFDAMHLTGVVAGGCCGPVSGWLLLVCSVGMPPEVQYSNYFFAYVCKKTPLQLPDGPGQKGRLPVGWVEGSRELFQK